MGDLSDVILELEAADAYTEDRQNTIEIIKETDICLDALLDVYYEFEKGKFRKDGMTPSIVHQIDTVSGFLEHGAIHSTPKELMKSDSLPLKIITGLVGAASGYVFATPGTDPRADILSSLLLFGLDITYLLVVGKVSQVNMINSNKYGNMLYSYSFSDKYSNKDIAIVAALRHDDIEKIMEPYYKEKASERISGEDYSVYYSRIQSYKNRLESSGKYGNTIFEIVSRLTRKFKVDRLIDLLEDVQEYFETNNICLEDIINNYPKVKDLKKYSLLKWYVPGIFYSQKSYAIISIAAILDYYLDEPGITHLNFKEFYLKESELISGKLRSLLDGLKEKGKESFAIALLEQKPELGEREGYDYFISNLARVKPISNTEGRLEDGIAQAIKATGDFLNNVKTIDALPERETQVNQAGKYIIPHLIEEFLWYVDTRFISRSKFRRSLFRAEFDNPDFSIYFQVLINLYDMMPASKKLQDWLYYRVNYQVTAPIFLPDYSPKELIPILFEAYGELPVADSRNIGKIQSPKRDYAETISGLIDTAWQDISPILSRYKRIQTRIKHIEEFYNNQLPDPLKSKFRLSLPEH